MAKARRLMAAISDPVEKKGFFQSLTMWAALPGYIPLLMEIYKVFANIPPELIFDTKTLILTTISSTLVIIGRWRAHFSKVEGIWK